MNELLKVGELTSLPSGMYKIAIVQYLFPLQLSLNLTDVPVMAVGSASAVPGHGSSTVSFAKYRPSSRGDNVF